METKLPDLSQMSSKTLELETVLVNGQKLLFDKKVKLMPVDIEKQKDKID
ncbi:hypothetical protein [Lacinutrix sp. Hel_I_90]|nr:hypothetical protein [Lacinutrix sp. Hel_I_90]